MRNASPLRYPGGKWRFRPFFERLISLNFDEPPIYVEPYAGGASLALGLLFSGSVSEIFLNDLDPAIHAFWHSVFRHTNALVDLIENARVTVAEWKSQKNIHAVGRASGMLKLGYATFFLNRTNHSGILNGGMIGGKNQSGDWKLDARFNRPELIRRIRRAATFKNKIHLDCQDASKLLTVRRFKSNTLVYLDPPYYRAGAHLYLNAYRPDDHALVRDCAKRLRCPWVVSYDDVPAIRRLYREYQSRHIQLLHTARSAKIGSEALFFSPKLRLPAMIW